MNKERFFDYVRGNLFGGSLTQGVVDTINTINDALDKHCITDYRQRAYVFATAFHESYSRTLNPNWNAVREGWGKSDASAIAAVTSLYKSGKISQNYALPQANGKSYFGRGFVQITHSGNYKALGAKLGIDLYGNPDLALDKKIAAEIMVVGMKYGMFTGVKLSTYFTDTKTDNKNARRIINGTDATDRIAAFAEKFYTALILK